MSKIFIIFIISFLSVNSIIENEINLNLIFRENKVETIGKKGTAIFSFSQSSIPQEFKYTKKETWFISKISDGNTIHEVNCGLWNGQETSYEIFIICDIEESIPSGEYSVLLNEVEPFTYGDYNVTLDVGQGQKDLKFKKVDKDIIDLYADSQTLTIEDGIDTYDLKFNIVSYNQEQLVFNYFMFLNNCKNENNILTCTIKKTDLVGYLGLQHQDFVKISYLDSENYNRVDFILIPDIKIVIKNIKKIDIFIGIKKLLTPTSESDSSIVYETNVTEISNINLKMTSFLLPFINKNGDNPEIEQENKCIFLKYEKNPLILECDAVDEGENWLKEIQKEMIISDNNILYNYRIQPVKIEDKIYVKGEGSDIFYFYPMEIDFSKKSDPLFIYYNLRTPENLNGLIYNDKEKDLICENIGDDMKKCEVTKDHFKGKENGLYFLKYNNYLGNKTISYQIPPLKVILNSSSKGNIISLSLFSSLILLLFMI